MSDTVSMTGNNAPFSWELDTVKLQLKFRYRWKVPVKIYFISYPKYM